VVTDDSLRQSILGLFLHFSEGHGALRRNRKSGSEQIFEETSSNVAATAVKPTGTTFNLKNNVL
jgi:hypothetical protein